MSAATIPYTLLHTLRACLDGTASQPQWDAAKDELDELLLAEPEAMSPVMSAAATMTHGCECGPQYADVCDGRDCFWDEARP